MPRTVSHRSTPTSHAWRCRTDDDAVAMGGSGVSRMHRRRHARAFVRHSERQEVSAAHAAGKTLLAFRAAGYKDSGHVYDPWRARGCKSHGPRPVVDDRPLSPATAMLLLTAAALGG